MSEKEEALKYHQQGRPGKIEVVATKPLTTQRHLSQAYTPGVAEACRAIANEPEDVFKYTAKGNLVAVITNGTAVLGLGDLGPAAAKPVMEGKANLFKKFADIDVFDIELNARTADELVTIIKAMAPTFGGINLEDIKAPECFDVEQRLQEELDIPIFHDDQHGTAIISAAALLNAIELSQRDISSLQLVINGAGAAAIACAELYISLGMTRSNIVMFDSQGAITTSRGNLPSSKKAFATKRKLANLREALNDADAFIGLSVGNVLTGEDIQGMTNEPIIFAMANPDPEIPYHEAKEARPDAILATGRSDYPNQVNNVLGFPFVFRGTLDCRARKITQEMKVAATRALAALAREDVPDKVLGAYGLSNLRFGPDYIIPKPFDARVLTWVAPAVARAAEESGVAREPIVDYGAYRERLHQIVERARGIMRPLLRRAKSSPHEVRIVFPDGRNMQMLRAAQVLVDEGICTPILIGRRDGILERAKEVDVDIAGMEIEEVMPGKRFDELANALWSLRGRKGMTHPSARMNLRSASWYGAMMVREGLADGMVAGLGRPYKHTVRPALQVLGVEKNSGLVSGSYAMLFKNRKIFFGDCTVNIDPNAEQLADIAINTARIAEMFGEQPRVAMLSYSDFGEHSRDSRVRKVQEAVQILRERRPDLQVDGEMQADTAVNWGKMKNDFPICTLTGPPNVLIFPDLTSGNIAYKLLQNLTDAEALGPLLVGLGGPVSVIPVSAGVNEIINITTYTVVQALERRR